ncbi:DUF6048 family protein [Zeaxanthinibacter sp. PT1]|uniref:DUF6048 family protein n=1 Tax=Zeaxanthinibacter TaxID=561554 RepID=UPI00234BE19E|nr:DUF6048 family protein [Zeaxanthinibacter sp. PT1]MDC6351778.1 DUF6048 family protein [Zeaxanthinibacter sp. PT1]
MSKYIISLLLFACLLSGFAQETAVVTKGKDSISYKQPYGLRVGIDLSKVALSYFNEDYTGFEVVGDYRLSQNLYLAGELGREEKRQSEILGNGILEGDILLYDFTPSGNYLKLGVDLNTYDNWYGMNNSIYLGGRYAFSTFKQTLNDYQLYDTNRYWNADGFSSGNGELNGEYSGLNASWLEFLFGVKVEMFKNLYMGASARIMFLVSSKDSEVMPNLWIPGFTKVTDGSNFGVNYNYTLSYMIPLYKKAKKIKPEINP